MIHKLKEACCIWISLLTFLRDLEEVLNRRLKFGVTFVPNLVLPKSAGPTMSYLVSER